MARAFLVVLDSVGCGGAEDAAAYGDEGADTLGHIAAACASRQGDRAGLRSGPLHVPNLVALGLAQACAASTGKPLTGIAPLTVPQGRWGYGVEVSHGKDTPSGHWEMAGCPVLFDWGYFRDLTDSFPPELVAGIAQAAGVAGILGNCHASGTEIIERLGAAHVRTGQPICYTSVDSVLQIAAHEEVFGLQRLYDLCARVRTLVDPYRIGRVIARPFVGSETAGFTRTANRKDFSVQPPTATILDACAQAGREIISVGKIGDIFAHRNTGAEWKGKSNAEHVALMRQAQHKLAEGGFCFTNLVEFDTEFGHRRDVPGYAACLEAFDRQVPALRAGMRNGDLMIITADHGNDPTWRGTDHTREHVPILAFGPGVGSAPLGRRESFADMAASLAQWLDLPEVGPGTAW